MPWIARCFAGGLLFLLLSCADQSDELRQDTDAGLATQIDSTGDSVKTITSGAVAPEVVRSLVMAMVIAPEIDDTSLFTEVTEFDVGRDGSLWVFDSPGNRIFRFDAQGKLLGRIGRQGGGPGEFNSNNGMVATRDSGLAQWDARNGRISFFDREGAFLDSWVIPTGFNTSNGLISDHSGRLYLRRPVTPPREGEILGRMGLVSLKGNGAFGDSLIPPDIMMAGQEVYLAERKVGDGWNRSSMSAQYAPQGYWSWHPEGGFVAGHGGDYAIVVAELSGRKPVIIRRHLPAVGVTGEEREQEKARIIWSLRQTDPGWSWKGPELPSVKAPLLGITATRDGRIWARVAAPSEPIPEAELLIPRDSTQPVVRFRTPVVYEVFSSGGVFLGRVEFPARARLIEADGDFVWGLVRSEDDLPGVARFRLDRPFAGR